MTAVSGLKMKSVKINADIPVTEQSLGKHNSSRVPIISVMKAPAPKKGKNGDLCIKGITKFIDEKTPP